jgi:predicted nucleic acid-binding protein
VIIVSDNSALSCLAQIGHLELLRELFGTVVITTTIQREGLHPRAPEALRALFTSPPEWLRIIQDPTP